jgi:hypothetical protein
MSQTKKIPERLRLFRRWDEESDWWFRHDWFPGL